jgi:ubiquinone/menaquinone biosynthesis C-methylase UbiE
VHQKSSSADRRQDRFAQWAPHYEDGDVLSQLLLELQDRAVTRLRLAPRDRFLDVGCATGAAVRAASSTVELAVGVDTSVAMVRHARTLATARSNTAFVVADAQGLPFPPASFSAVLSSTALRHFSNAAGAVVEMVRVLAPGGRIVVADFLVRSDDLGGRWRYALRRSTVAADLVGPLETVSATGVVVTEAFRIGTAIGRYAIVSAVKPKFRIPRRGPAAATIGTCCCHRRPAIDTDPQWPGCSPPLPRRYAVSGVPGSLVGRRCLLPTRSRM